MTIMKKPIWKFISVRAARSRYSQTWQIKNHLGLCLFYEIASWSAKAADISGMNGKLVLKSKQRLIDTDRFWLIRKTKNEVIIFIIIFFTFFFLILAGPLSW